MNDSPIMQRIDEQIVWYDRKATQNQLFYKCGKLIVIVAAALIPFLSGHVDSWFIGALGVLIAVVEGIQQLNQYHANWTSFRATCEALKHEKYLYLANAGSYASAHNTEVLLAERVETLVSQETAKWALKEEKIEQRPSEKPRGEQQDSKSDRPS